MKYSFLFFFMMIICLGNYSCKKKTCPAYQENQKEEYKIKNQKRKKAKLF
ncbi:MAG: hypothetical protein JNL75_10535 [Chitinophagales bacterium]|nr:hypothetical protein [Chitinophagales bacterium]